MFLGSGYFNKGTANHKVTDMRMIEIRNGLLSDTINYVYRGEFLLSACESDEKALHDFIKYSRKKGESELLNQMRIPVL